MQVVQIHMDLETPPTKPVCKLCIAGSALEAQEWSKETCLEPLGQQEFGA